MATEGFFAILAFLSLMLLIWQWLAARRFPLHRRIPSAGFIPAITVFKPLKDRDAATRACLESWFRHNYPGDMQLLFGVASAADPVCRLVAELIAAHPGIDARLVICNRPPGANAKVSTLAQLQPHAIHDVWIISDADVLIPPGFVEQLVLPLRDSRIGLVNCFYQIAHPATPGLRWEAVAVNADFWSQVLQGQTMRKSDFGLGAALATTREQVTGIGGFTPLANHLADDYHLGNQIAARGRGVAFCPVPVECHEPARDWIASWQHQLRWARTVRVCEPLPYFLSILNNVTVWPLLWLLLHPSLPVAAIALMCWAIRVLAANDLQSRLTRTSAHWQFWWMVPLKDVLGFGIWAGAFLGNTVEWRGSKYLVRQDGTVTELPPVQARPRPAPVLALEKQAEKQPAEVQFR